MRIKNTGIKQSIEVVENKESSKEKQFEMLSREIDKNLLKPIKNRSGMKFYFTSVGGHGFKLVPIEIDKNKKSQNIIRCKSPDAIKFMFTEKDEIITVDNPNTELNGWQLEQNFIATFKNKILLGKMAGKKEVSTNNNTPLHFTNFSYNSKQQFNGIDRSISPKGHINLTVGYSDHMHLVNIHSNHKIELNSTDHFNREDNVYKNYHMISSN